MAPLRIFSVSALLFALGCSPGGLDGAGEGSDGDGDGDGSGGGDLDPNNPPENPFGDDPFPGIGTCADTNAVVSGLTPTVQLLIDQSGSMDADFQNTDRWNAVYQTLMGGDGVVSRLQSGVKFGLSLYTSFNGQGQCPRLQEVAPALNNQAAIDAVFGPAGPEDDTPTGEALMQVAAQLQGAASEGPKIIVLGTDGLPDTCSAPDPDEDDFINIKAAQNTSIEAAQSAFDAGIRTFVVSVGDDTGADHLQDMANAGAGLAVDGPERADYYVALNPDQLAAAFTSIVGSVTGCVFTMEGSVDPAKGAMGRVALDGEELTYGEGWILVDGKTFEILGDACDIIQDGDLHHVAAVFPCGSVSVD